MSTPFSTDDTDRVRHRQQKGAHNELSRIRTKAGYFPVPPQDSAQDMRSEMLGASASR
jgi:hypothetical protein